MCVCVSLNLFVAQAKIWENVAMNGVDLLLYLENTRVGSKGLNQIDHCIKNICLYLSSASRKLKDEKPSTFMKSNTASGTELGHCGRILTHQASPSWSLLRRVLWDWFKVILDNCWRRNTSCRLCEMSLDGSSRPNQWWRVYCFIFVVIIQYWIDLYLGLDIIRPMSLMCQKTHVSPNLTLHIADTENKSEWLLVSIENNLRQASRLTRAY